MKPLNQISETHLLKGGGEVNIPDHASPIPSKARVSKPTPVHGFCARSAAAGTGGGPADRLTARHRVTVAPCLSVHRCHPIKGASA